MNILNKIKNLIKWGKLKSTKDEKIHQVGEFEFKNLVQLANIFSPYGLFSNPEDGAFSILLQPNGKEDSLVALVWNPTKRPKLEKGQVALGTENGRMTLTLSPDGKIQIEGASDDLIALIYELSDITETIVNKLATTTVATSLGTQPLSTQADFINLLTDIVPLVTKINNFVKS